MGGRFPGLPSVALGYDWLARFAGCQANLAADPRCCITFAEVNNIRVKLLPD
jgi:hypothetical protein